MVVTDPKIFCRSRLMNRNASETNCPLRDKQDPSLISLRKAVLFILFSVKFSTKQFHTEQEQEHHAGISVSGNPVFSTGSE